MEPFFLSSQIKRHPELPQKKELLSQELLFYVDAKREKRKQRFGRRTSGRYDRRCEEIKYPDYHAVGFNRA